MGERGEPELIRESRWIFAALLSAAVLTLVTAMVASPGASDSAEASDDDQDLLAAGEAEDDSHEGHDMDDPEADDEGLAELMSIAHYHPTSDEPIDNETQRLLTAQLAATNDLVQRYPTIADAEADGWRRAGPFAPGFGTHYSNEEVKFTIKDAPEGDEGEQVEAQLIFDGLDDDSPLAGFMLLGLGGEPPEGFAGPYDNWHEHTNICVVVTPEAIETPFIADQEDVTEEMCDDLGGDFLDLTAQMVHVWTVPGYESEMGTFSELNPAITCPDGTYHIVPIEDDDFFDPTVCVN